MTMGDYGNASYQCVPGQESPYPDVPPTLTENFTSPPVHIYEDWEIGLMVTAYTIAMAMAIIGNIVVIMTVVLNVRMRTSTNIYLVNLAISDLIVGTCNMWIQLVSNITPSWVLGAFACVAFSFTQICSLTASSLFMMVIACERFVAILYPLKARFSKPHQHAIVMVSVWLVAILVAIPNILVRQLNELIWADFHQIWCTEEWRRYGRLNSNGTCEYYYPQRQLYYTLQVLVMYFVPVIVMVVLLFHRARVV